MEHRELDERVAAWLTAEAAKRAAVAFARDVAADGATLMAIKGVHLAWCFDAEPWRRAMADVDLLVLGGDFAAVVRRAVATGRWRIAKDYTSTKTLVSVETSAVRIGVDLHRWPLPPFFGRMRANTLLARARSGAPHLEGLVVPDPVDAAVLVVTHMVKDGIRSVNAAADLSLVSDAVDPRELAERFAEHGLRRVGVVGLSVLVEQHPRFEPWLSALAPRKAEIVVARAAARAIARWASPASAVSLACVRPFQDDFARATLSTAFGALRLVRDAWFHPDRRRRRAA